MPFGGGGSVNAATLAGYEVGYDQATTDVSITATTSPGDAVVTGTAHTFDGDAVFAHFFAIGAFTPATASANIRFFLYEGASQIGDLFGYEDLSIATGTNHLIVPVSCWYRFTPSAGSHTYKVTAYVSSGTGTVYATAGTSNPAFLRFVKA